MRKTFFSVQVCLLSLDTRANLNLWLNRQELSAEEAADYIEVLDDTHFSTASVQSLMEILPSNDEVSFDRNLFDFLGIFY